MPIQLSIVGEDATEFAKHLAGVVRLSFQRIEQAVADSPPATTFDVPSKQAEAPSDKKRTRKPAAAKNGGLVDEKQEDIDKDLTPAPSQADVKEALLALLSAKGDDAPPTLLKEEFGVGKISELKAAQYADVIAKAKAAAS